MDIKLAWSMSSLSWLSNCPKIIVGLSWLGHTLSQLGSCQKILIGCGHQVGLVVIQNLLSVHYFLFCYKCISSTSSHLGSCPKIIVGNGHQVGLDCVIFDNTHFLAQHRVCLVVVQKLLSVIDIKLAWSLSSLSWLGSCSKFIIGHQNQQFDVCKHR
jgi:hypothetical protein